jgi:hypothetical protein
MTAGSGSRYDTRLHIIYVQSMQSFQFPCYCPWFHSHAYLIAESVQRIQQTVVGFEPGGVFLDGEVRF